MTQPRCRNTQRRCRNTQRWCRNMQRGCGNTTPRVSMLSYSCTTSVYFCTTSGDAEVELLPDDLRLFSGYFWQILANLGDFLATVWLILSTLG